MSGDLDSLIRQESTDANALRSGAGRLLTQTQVESLDGSDALKGEILENVTMFAESVREQLATYRALGVENERDALLNREAAQKLTALAQPLNKAREHPPLTPEQARKKKIKLPADYDWSEELHKWADQKVGPLQDAYNAVADPIEARERAMAQRTSEMLRIADETIAAREKFRAVLEAQIGAPEKPADEDREPPAIDVSSGNQKYGSRPRTKLKKKKKAVVTNREVKENLYQQVPSVWSTVKDACQIYTSIKPRSLLELQKKLDDMAQSKKDKVLAAHKNALAGMGHLIEATWNHHAAEILAARRLAKIAAKELEAALCHLNGDTYKAAAAALDRTNLLRETIEGMMRQATHVRPEHDKPKHLFTTPKSVVTHVSTQHVRLASSGTDSLGFGTITTMDENIEEGVDRTQYEARIGSQSVLGDAMNESVVTTDVGANVRIDIPALTPEIERALDEYRAKRTWGQVMHEHQFAHIFWLNPIPYDPAKDLAVVELYQRERKPEWEAEGKSHMPQWVSSARRLQIERARQQSGDETYRIDKEADVPGVYPDVHPDRQEDYAQAMHALAGGYGFEYYKGSVGDAATARNKAQAMFITIDEKLESAKFSLSGTLQKWNDSLAEGIVRDDVDVVSEWHDHMASRIGPFLDHAPTNTKADSQQKLAGFIMEVLAGIERNFSSPASKSIYFVWSRAILVQLLRRMDEAPVDAEIIEKTTDDAPEQNVVTTLLPPQEPPTPLYPFGREITGALDAYRSKRNWGQLLDEHFNSLVQWEVETGLENEKLDEDSLRIEMKHAGLKTDTSPVIAYWVHCARRMQIAREKATTKDNAKPPLPSFIQNDVIPGREAEYLSAKADVISWGPAVQYDGRTAHPISTTLGIERLIQGLPGVLKTASFSLEESLEIFQKTLRPEACPNGVDIVAGWHARRKKLDFVFRNMNTKNTNVPRTKGQLAGYARQIMLALSEKQKSLRLADIAWFNETLRELRDLIAEAPEA